jgi:hypothetical protein
MSENLENLGTKLARLQSTVRYVEQLWYTEQQSQPKNSVNEGAWSVLVIEPILYALDWPRLLRRELSGTGAYYEWPAKHKVDVALLDCGEPAGFLELKGKHIRNKKFWENELGKKLRKHVKAVKLRSARVRVAAWFEGDEAGLCPYEVQADGSLRQGINVTLRDASQDASALAQLAAAVLLDRQSDKVWLHSEERDAGPVIPRCNPRDFQRRFFELLTAKFNIGASLELRHRCRVFAPPTPTYAYTELPGILASGSGLVFDFDNTMNQLQCFFYRDGNRKVDGTGKWSFDHTGMNDTVLEAFLNERVLPKIEQRRIQAGKHNASASISDV